MIRFRYALGAAAFALLLWQGILLVTGVPSFILPSPMQVTKATIENRTLIVANALVTATEVFWGLLMGTILGALTAIQLANSARLHRLLMPLLIFTQAVPVFALAPILTCASRACETAG